MVLTDSGGLQEEATALGKPVIVMRNVTERPEGILAGASRLAGTNKEQIVATVSAVLSDHAVLESMANAKSPYGDGFASKRIVDFTSKITSMSDDGILDEKLDTVHEFLDIGSP